MTNIENNWFHEQHADGEFSAYRVEKTLFREQSEFQEVTIVETTTYGRMLIIDGCIMTTERDEFVYHEMLAHVPLFTHPAPKKVLIIGGGDGGTLREVLRHETVEKVVMVEIDGLVIDACKKHLPSIASEFDHPKAEVIVGDGIDYVKEADDKSFDVVLVDGTDPVGPSEVLFNDEFYANVSRIITENGFAATHLAASTFLRHENARRIISRLTAAFELVGTYAASIPTYYAGQWLFAIASNLPFPSHPQPIERAATLECKQYNAQIHMASFALPPFVRDSLIFQEVNGPSSPTPGPVQ